MRIDKFLKVSRIIKRRTVAQEACDKGRIDINGRAVKPSKEIKEGDVVTFVAPEGFGQVEGYTVTHRVVKAPFEGEDGRLYIRTKGDAAAGNDAVPVPLANVTGLVLGKSEVLAGLQSVLKSKAGFLLIIVVPLVLIAVWQIAVFAVASAKEKRKKELAAKAGELADDEVEQIKKRAVEEYLAKRDDDETDGDDTQGR